MPDRLIGGIEIYENFSFVTVPFEAAEKVLAEARTQGGLPAVRYATPKAWDAPRGPASRGAPGGRAFAGRGGSGAPYGARPNRPGDYPPRAERKPRRSAAAHEASEPRATGSPSYAKKRKKPE